MGFESIDILGSMVRATSGLRWSEEGQMADVLAMIDADISQAIQSCKEEMARGCIRDIVDARKALHNLRTALNECQVEVESWGGEFPFERGASNAACLQI